MAQCGVLRFRANLSAERGGAQKRPKRAEFGCESDFTLPSTSESTFRTCMHGSCMSTSIFLRLETSLSSILVLLSDSAGLLCDGRHGLLMELEEHTEGLVGFRLGLDSCH